MPEQWKSVVGLEGQYEVSDYGRVRSLDRVIQTRKGPRRRKGQILKPHHIGPYPSVTLPMAPKNHTIHTLMLRTFVGPCPDGQEARHINGDPTDNRLENLAWGTPKENAADQAIHGTKFSPWRGATHCKAGHEFTEENTVYHKQGYRRCRQCMSLWAKAQWQRDKERKRSKDDERA